MMEGVLFDLDGIITDTAKFHFKAWKQLAQDELNITLPASFESQLKGISRMESMKLILKFANLEDNFSEKEVFQLANKKNELYLREINKLTQADILPGIENLLDALAANRILLSIASASKNAPLILEKLGLLNRFDAIANPENVANGKPAPDIFIEAAHQIGLSPEKCVGIEDAPAGVIAIKKAKAVAVGVGDDAELNEADVVVNKTSNLSYLLLVDTYDKKYLNEPKNDEIK